MHARAAILRKLLNEASEDTGPSKYQIVSLMYKGLFIGMQDKKTRCFILSIGKVFDRVHQKMAPALVSNPMLGYVNDEEQNLLVFRRKLL